jgi:hypothetical protein
MIPLVFSIDSLKNNAKIVAKEKDMNGYELMAAFERTVREVIMIPNDWLPENFRDNRTDSVSLADLERKCDSIMISETDHQIEKREKDMRIAAYAAMIANGQEITYIMK